ncbi:probable cation-transporting ATPase 13A5, partial [Dendroctonus ponderosae]|uniref:probable cation-transporting ATPase 13A5 n=1 Tax=Dendroctonus ponderosae TaxID=77166 RepID=UPI0020359E2D
MVSHLPAQQGDNLTKAVKVEQEICTNADPDGVQLLNFGEDDQMEIQGFTFSELRARLCLIFHVATLGILRLIFHWYPIVHLKSTHRRCSLSVAQKALITDDYNGKTRTHFVKRILTLTNRDQGKLLKFRLADGRTQERQQVRPVKCKKLS